MDSASFFEVSCRGKFPQPCDSSFRLERARREWPQAYPSTTKHKLPNFGAFLHSCCLGSCCYKVTFRAASARGEPQPTVLNNWDTSCNSPCRTAAATSVHDDGRNRQTPGGKSESIDLPFYMGD